jgi:hypothetical protein
VEILPGIRASTPARATRSSRHPRGRRSSFVLASDNCYLYRNLAEHKASATFSEADQPGNIKTRERMIALAGPSGTRRPRPRPRQFERFPTQGRIAKIR